MKTKLGNLYEQAARYKLHASPSYREISVIKERERWTFPGIPYLFCACYYPQLDDCTLRVYHFLSATALQCGDFASFGTKWIGSFVFPSFDWPCKQRDIIKCKLRYWFIPVCETNHGSHIRYKLWTCCIPKSAKVSQFSKVLLEL